MTDLSKSMARREAKARRSKVTARAKKAKALCRQFPWPAFKSCRFAGFWPLHDEIDLRPLMTFLHSQDLSMSLPVTGPAGTALSFKAWTPDDDLQAGRFGTLEPISAAPEMVPDFIFLPLLAFNAKGHRLGYGGGYYDRTIANLRLSGQVFTCGVGYDAQEMAHIPIQPHDIQLEAILTPSGFRRISS